ncbi:hypothetical protein PoMZ_06841 [Pyricularia oryzae]|uniref:Peptide transporter MTD1 n=1 Tax=Pyricularia oryzae TaxID=318829 RepID=A0A4P7NTB0_PYROR|nr:hypothetical protein PoMZ_06841 [Pyricularia oryzae]
MASSQPFGDAIIGAALDPVSGKAVSAPAHDAINEKLGQDKSDVIAATSSTEKGEIQPARSAEDSDNDKGSESDPDAIIVTGTDVARHLLPLRDDADPSLTFRSMVLATGLSGFQSVMNQIYQFKPTLVTIQGTFIVLIAYFLGQAWAKFLPRGDRLEARWRSKGGEGKVPLWIRIVSFFNYGEWGLKEHAICAVTATAASNAAASSTVFSAQLLFYDLPLSATTVVLTVISIGLFGYGLCGILRPVTVWHVDAVYWSTLPTVKTLQGLHWQEIKSSKPIRYFWIAFVGMFFYEFFPAYIWPWLNAVSIPCLASMNATGATGATLTRLFGGSLNNEGLGLFTLSFDWQYITSFNTSLPLVLQAHTAVGYFICFLAMLGIYYTNQWDAKSQPFMSTKLRSEDGGSYPTAKVFAGGILDHAALAKYGIPMLSGTFAYAMFMANAAIGALVTHCFLFWGGDIKKTYRSAREGRFDDPHHVIMAKNYKETPWWWFMVVLVGSFVLGLIVVTTQDVTLPAWAYIVSLLLGSIIAPFSTLLYSRYGNGIATNNLSKMIAGLILPERPIANMYFAAFSHNVINCTLNLSNDLKIGEYLKIPPRIIGFINYAVMISIVTGNKDLLVNGNGDASWSGATIQSYNTNATSWALASYLYKAGGLFPSDWELVPPSLLPTASSTTIGRFDLLDINMPQLIQYAGYIPYNASQTCVLFSQVISGFFIQFYLRNYRPRIFKDYSYLVTGAFDGGSLLALFILSFAVFGAGGAVVAFPQWWGNNVAGNYDLCPAAE